jgi:hypothetical protein
MCAETTTQDQIRIHLTPPLARRTYVRHAFNSNQIRDASKGLSRALRSRSGQAGGGAGGLEASVRRNDHVTPRFMRVARDTPVREAGAAREEEGEHHDQSWGKIAERQATALDHEWSNLRAVQNHPPLAGRSARVTNRRVATRKARFILKCGAGTGTPSLRVGR